MQFKPPRINTKYEVKTNMFLEMRFFLIEYNSAWSVQCLGPSVRCLGHNLLKLKYVTSGYSGFPLYIFPFSFYFWHFDSKYYNKISLCFVLNYVKMLSRVQRICSWKSLVWTTYDQWAVKYLLFWLANQFDVKVV